MNMAIRQALAEGVQESSSTVPSGRMNRSAEGVLRSAVRDAIR